MPSIRQSPSGPPIPGGIDTSSDGIINQSLVPDAATLTVALNRLATSYSNLFRDDFASGANTSTAGAALTAYGQKNWTYLKNFTNNISRPTNAGGGINIGGYAPQCSPNNGFCTLLLGAGVSSPGVGIRPERIDYALFRVIPQNLSNFFQPSRAGFGQIANVGTDFGTDGIYFESNANTSPNWRVVIRKNNIPSNVTTAIPAVNTLYNMLEMRRNAITGEYTFFIGGVLVRTVLAADLPTITLIPMIQQNGSVNSTSNVTIDRFEMQYTRRPLA